MSQICLDCPDYMIGLCKDIKNCPYQKHDKCPDNYLCVNEFCTKGHGITLIKRELINNIYTDFYNNNFDESDIQCEYPLNCFSENCLKSHYVDFKYRKVISNIINPKHNDSKAIEIFNNFIPSKNLKSTTITIDKLTITIDKPTINKSWASVVSPVSSPICVTKSDLVPKINVEDDDLDAKLRQLSKEIKESKTKIKETEEHISNLRIEYNQKIVESEQLLNNLHLELEQKKQESKKLALEFIEQS
tara:strand:+ start:176 stop:913 length:738 start_codon:yes stop_codon:yes gene_type:complete